MKVWEYISLNGVNMDYTFIKARARKDAHTPMYHPEYQTTPIRTGFEWMRNNNSPILDYVVLNDKQASITWLSGVDWNINIKRGTLKCLLIINPDDYKLLIPGKEQRKQMEKFIEKKLF